MGSEMCIRDSFYSAIMKVLDIPIITTSEDFFWADELVVSSINSPAAQGILTGRHHLAFQVKDRTTVDNCYQAALAHKGKDNGKPAERTYHPEYYAAFVIDPDGNNIEFVYHGEAQRSTSCLLYTSDAADEATIV